MDKLEKIKKLAFTLAEVIIVIGIVGIVAEMVIPMLVNNVQKTVYVTSAKTTYAKVNSVLVKLALDRGCIGDLKCTGLFSGDTNSANLGNAIDDYFKTVKNCGNAGSGGCFSTVYPNFDKTGTTTNYDTDTAGFKFTTTDGMNYYVYNNNDGCASFSNAKSNHMTQRCGYILVDTNGSKLPNAMGRDVFKFWISNGKGPALYPAGGMDDKSGAGNTDAWWKTIGCGTSNNAGDACAGRIFENGWQMDY